MRRVHAPLLARPAVKAAVLALFGGMFLLSCALLPRLERWAQLKLNTLLPAFKLVPSRLAERQPATRRPAPPPPLRRQFTLVPGVPGVPGGAGAWTRA